ncbi:MAG: hypothetical protein ACLFSE_01210 [Spirochaetia bacterium]
MIKKIVFIPALILLGTVSIFSIESEETGKILPLEKEIRDDLYAASDIPISDITVGDITSLFNKYSIVRQQKMYIKKAEMKSILIPGWGQFSMGDRWNGVLFMGVHVLLKGGTLLGSYFLLPNQVRFSSINYFTAPAESIEAAWKNLSFMDLLPALGAYGAGTMACMLLRKAAASHAGQTARQRITEGDVTFTPVFHSDGIGIRAAVP